MKSLDDAEEAAQIHISHVLDTLMARHEGNLNKKSSPLDDDNVTFVLYTQAAAAFALPSHSTAAEDLYAIFKGMPRPLSLLDRIIELRKNGPLGNEAHQWMREYLMSQRISYHVFE